MKRTGGGAARLAGTSILATLVVLFDYALKFSGLKIPFPWLPFLKFDFTGIPIALALLLYGLPSGTTTSAVALIAILARSGDLVGATSKAIAELSTVFGMAVGLSFPTRFRRMASLVIGIALRIAVMSVVNLIVLPSFYGFPYNVAVVLLPMIGVFNAVQGALTTLIGYTLFEAYIRRIPTKPGHQLNARATYANYLIKIVEKKLGFYTIHSKE